LELWQQLTSSTPGLLNTKRGGGASKSGAAGARDGPGAGGAKSQDPIDDFVQLENDLAGDLITAVDGALQALKKVISASFLNTSKVL
jgi:hypothetical protein